MTTLPWWLTFTTSALNIEVQCTFWSCFVFVIAYTCLAPWWRSSMGRSLVILDGSIALAVTPAMLNRYFHVNVLNTEWVAWWTVVCFMAITGVLISRTFLVTRINWNNARLLHLRQCAHRLRAWVTSLASRRLF